MIGKKEVVLLLIWIAFTFTSCRALTLGTRILTPDLLGVVPYLIWAASMFGLFFLNRKIKAMSWPIEFMLWMGILLIVINLLWLKWT